MFCAFLSPKRLASQAHVDGAAHRCSKYNFFLKQVSPITRSYPDHDITVTLKNFKTSVSDKSITELSKDVNNIELPFYAFLDELHLS